MNMRINDDLVESIIDGNKKIIFATYNEDYFTFVTKQLLVTNKALSEKKTVGNLAVRIDLTGSKKKPIEILSLTVGFGDPSFPSIPHMEYSQNKVRSVCWGNYSFLDDAITSRPERFVSNIRKIILFCESVNIHDSFAVSNFKRLPLVDNTAIQILHRNVEFNLIGVDITNQPDYRKRQNVLFVFDNNGYPHLLSDWLWNFRASLSTKPDGKRSYVTQICGGFLFSPRTTKFRNVISENKEIVRILDFISYDFPSAPAANFSAVEQEESSETSSQKATPPRIQLDKNAKGTAVIIRPGTEKIVLEDGSEVLMILVPFMWPLDEDLEKFN
jgi:hypothetical protein